MTARSLVDAVDGRRRSSSLADAVRDTSPSPCENSRRCQHFTLCGMGQLACNDWAAFIDGKRRTAKWCFPSRKIYLKTMR